MGIPEHYSRDIPSRCQTLIDNLWPSVKRGFSGDRAFGGPLSTTFLLALATPMIVLPTERILKLLERRPGQVGDEREVDPELDQRIAKAFSPGVTFGVAPFRRGGRWSYVANWERFNIARDWPQELLHSLAEPEAAKSADEAPAKQIIFDLRNALAHGGVAYLDAEGRQTQGEAAMLAFAAAARSGRSALNILRVSEDDFLLFLQSWAQWLAKPRIRRILNQMDPLAA